jgi:hypothetical protein
LETRLKIEISRINTRRIRRTIEVGSIVAFVFGRAIQLVEISIISPDYRPEAPTRVHGTTTHTPKRPNQKTIF